MPIHVSKGGTTYTGSAIQLFAFVTQLKAAELEQKGIRVRKRGPALWKVYRGYYEIPGTGDKPATEQQVIDWMKAKCAEMKAKEEVTGE